MKQLYTSWGEKLKEEMKVGKEDLAVLTEYPRPSMMRDSYENLNGWWDYAITKQLDGEKIPDIYNGKILVPYSPEAALSGVEHQLQPDEYLWYHRELVKNRKKLDQGIRAPRGGHLGSSVGQPSVGVHHQRSESESLRPH